MSTTTPATQLDLTDQDLERLLASPAVGLDTETTGLNANRDLLCLVQLCDADGRVTMVRQRDWQDTPKLRTFLTSPSPVKIFHHALFDCGFIYKHVGVVVANVFCTKIASKLARTYTDKHSLAALVEELLGTKLDKTQQTTDWLTDDLLPEQLTYAANDVQHLIRLHDALEAKLRMKGSLPTGVSYWDLNQQCQAFIPTLVQLRLNGWDSGNDSRDSVFGY